MNAALQDLRAMPAVGRAGAPRLHARFANLSDSELLAHFATRLGVQLFSLPDPDESSREQADRIVAGKFCFNGECHALTEGFDWQINPSQDVEWHILLHKFYYATGLSLAWRETGDARYLATWTTLTESWISQVPPGFIAADVTGRRVQHWVYAFHHFVLQQPAAVLPSGFLHRFLASLEEQVAFLAANLTAKRNHRTLELHAIFLAAVAFPEFERATQWREFALTEIAANITADILDDGVHCELSTDYHHLVLKNYLSVRRLAAMNGIEVPAGFDERLEKALEFSLHVHRPDGIAPSLSDGDSRSFLELLGQGAELFDREDMRYVATGGRTGQPPAQLLRHFDASGYVTLRSGWGRGARAFADEHYLVFDCGPLGEGNHGHLDCLSFELAANGAPIVVDPGRYTYHEGGDVNWRVRFRGTAYHNTVTVDGRNQTRYEPRAVNGPSRHGQGVLRHRIQGPAPVARLNGSAVGPDLLFVGGTAMSAEYDAVHERQIALVFDRYWVILDHLRAPTSHRYDLWLHLSGAGQGCTTLCARGHTRIVRSALASFAFPAMPAQDVALEPGFVSTRYGHKEAAPVIRVGASGREARFLTVIDPSPGSAGVELRLPSADVVEANDGFAFEIIDRSRRDGKRIAVHLARTAADVRVEAL
ncbi:MAG: alginate lyase family protein [Steroidobacteraceae bacterium]